VRASARVRRLLWQTLWQAVWMSAALATATAASGRDGEADPTAAAEVAHVDGPARPAGRTGAVGATRPGRTHPEPSGPVVRILLFEADGTIAVRGGAAGVERIAPAGGGALRVDGRVRPGPIHRHADGVGGTLRVTASGEDWQLRGDLEVMRTPRGLAAINALPIEDYLVSSVGGEMSPTWETEALRAQAVVSRTYALHELRENRGEPYDLRADTGSQRYRGVADESDTVRGAVASTRCRILTYGGEPILAAFHSTSGGRTASAAEVWGRSVDYLVSREVDGEDASPDTYWRVALSGATLGRALAEAGWRVGESERVEIVSRSASGRVDRVRIRGDRGSAELTGRQLRSAVGETVLRSTLFEVRRSDSSEPGGARFVFAGTGYGHGVGMSQWGARAMAARGAGYEQILASFYPGTRLEGCDALARIVPEEDSR